MRDEGVSKGARLELVLDGAARAVEVGERIVIGRAPDSDLCIDKPSVSRRHAEVRRFEGGRYRVTDLGSLNGTFVNGHRVLGEREVFHGDELAVGEVTCAFSYPEGPAKLEPETDVLRARSPAPDERDTLLGLRDATVVVLVSDIRGYTSLTEKLPRNAFQTFVAEWFRDAIGVIEECAGQPDKMLGDAIMAYWTVRDPAAPGAEVDAALTAAVRLLERASSYEQMFQGRFDLGRFEIGIGINLGPASIGNVGTGEHQSFTVVGDSVVVAFRLEGLTREKNHPILTSWQAAQWAAPEFQFRNLGETAVKGRGEPVSVLALSLDPPSAVAPG